MSCGYPVSWRALVDVWRENDTDEVKNRKCPSVALKYRYCYIYIVFLIAGVPWDSESAINLAKKASDADNVEFQGIYVHCGNTYKADKDKDERVKIQTDTTDRLLDLKDR